MRRVRDLRCQSCGAIYIDEYCGDDFVCRCGGATSTYYGAQQLMSGDEGRKADAFVPVTFGGVRYDTREAWAGICREWKHNHDEDLNGMTEGDSPRARKARMEETKHANIAQARRRGMHHIADQIERSRL